MSHSLTNKKSERKCVLFLLLFWFQVIVCLSRFKYKDEYEKFKLALSSIALILSVINLIAGLRYYIAVWLYWFHILIPPLFH